MSNSEGAINRLTSGGDRFRWLSVIFHFRLEMSGTPGVEVLEAREVPRALGCLRVCTLEELSVFHVIAAEEI